MAIRVMVVEDDEDLREGLAILLGRPDREVADFGTGEQALDAFESAPFDVVVTDLGLPGMSGMELADRVHASRPETWVILASGAVDLPDLHPERKIRRVTKPFTVEELDALIDGLVQRGP